MIVILKILLWAIKSKPIIPFLRLWSGARGILHQIIFIFLIYFHACDKICRSLGAVFSRLQGICEEVVDAVI